MVLDSLILMAKRYGNMVISFTKTKPLKYPIPIDSSVLEQHLLKTTVLAGATCK